MSRSYYFWFNNLKKNNTYVTKINILFLKTSYKF